MRGRGTPAIGNADRFEMLSRCCFAAWKAGDRDLAQQFADPAAIDELFETSWSPYRFVECQKLLVGGTTSRRCADSSASTSRPVRSGSRRTGGTTADAARRLKGLDGENAPLKELLAEA